MDFIFKENMYAIFTHHDDAYQELAEFTWRQNKLIYAKKHGYDVYARTENFVTADGKVPMTGFEKLYIAKDLLEKHPEYKWVWWTGTDSLITNMNVRIEDRVLNQYHFIVSTDVNGINADSFLLRNSPEGLKFLDEWLETEEECSKFWDAEQRALALMLGLPVTADASWAPPGPIEIAEKYQSIVKLVPQRYLNAYNYSLYGGQYPDQRDKLGVNGNWSFGDWLIHWPGTPLQMRLELVKYYIAHVMR